MDNNKKRTTLTKDKKINIYPPYFSGIASGAANDALT